MAHTTNYQDFIDFQHSKIQNDSNYVVPLNDVQVFLSNTTSKFQDLYSEVSGYDLTPTEFETYANDYESRGCWICNEQACLVSTWITMGTHPPGWLGCIGIAVHCD